MNNWRKFLVLPVLLATVLFGTLYAQQVQTISTTITAQTTGSTAVEDWGSVGAPTWTPIEGTVGAMTAGGLVFVGVPAGGSNPPGTWTIAVYLKNPDELNDAYSFINMELQVREATHVTFPDGTHVADLTKTFTGRMTHSDLLNPDKGYTVFTVASTDGVMGKLVGADLKAVDQASDATHRIFTVGIGDGSFYTKSVAVPSKLSPQFYVEVRGR